MNFCLHWNISWEIENCAADGENLQKRSFDKIRCGESIPGKLDVVQSKTMLKLIKFLGKEGNQHEISISKLMNLIIYPVF